MQSGLNRQGRGTTLGSSDAEWILDLLRRDAERAHSGYIEMLNEDAEGNPIDPSRKGLARELARMNLTLNFYTQWYWKIDLHNLMHFLRLRTDSHAQYEIRAYAYVMLDVVRRWVPQTHDAFMDYRMGAVHLSASALKVVRRLLKGEPVEQHNSGLSKREWKDLMDVLEFRSTNDD